MNGVCHFERDFPRRLHQGWTTPGSYFQVGFQELPTLCSTLLPPSTSTKMVLSWNASIQAIVHVVENVLGRQAGSPLRLALVNEGVNEIQEFLNITEDSLDHYCYDLPDGSRNDIPLRDWDKTVVLSFIWYVVYRESGDNPIGDDWLNITREEFANYQRNNFTIPEQAAATIPRAANNNTGTATTSQYTPVAMFKQGIRWDPMLFPILKDKATTQSGIIPLWTKPECKVLKRS